MDAAFPLCMATDSLWRKKDVSLGSPLEVVIQLPMADIRSFPTEHNAPMVSNAIGTKWHASGSSAYFKHFLFVAASAAHPGVWVVPLRYDGEKVLATVTSHASALPDFQGTIVRPSGRFRLRLAGMWSRSRRLGLETVSRPIEGLISVSSRACRQTSRSRLGLGS